MTKRSLEIACTACGGDSLVKREPVYDGFVKVGERFRCLSCGHVYESEAEVPFKKTLAPTVFDPEDAPRQVDVFTEDEKTRNCRHCRHYVVNPFTQRCARHEKEVQATDVCDDFELPEAKAGSATD